MEPRRTQAEELHAQAQKWRRLASETLYPAVSEALIELASDYEHLAERLSRRGWTARRRQGVSSERVLNDPAHARARVLVKPPSCLRVTG